MIRATTFAGKRVAVFGLGGSGTATVTSLLAGGAEVAAWDDGERSREAAAKAGLPLVDLHKVDWSSLASLVLAPGVPLTHPEPHWTVKAASAAGVEIIGDIEIFCRERRAHAPGSPFVAITGTNGKSTTTALIAHILRTAGFDEQMGGNIGVPILSLEPPSAERIHVIEMSTFQIDLTPSLDPTIGVLLNLSPDHLDRHGPADDPALAMRNYAAIKERLIEGSLTTVVGVDDEACRAIAERAAARGQGVQAVSVHVPVDEGWTAVGGELARHVGGIRQPVWDIGAVKTLRGRHNWQNAAAASAVIYLLDADFGAMHLAIEDYPGLPHRMEAVGRTGKVLFINDSKATNADSTEKALASWERDIFWILGGKPKEGGIRPLEGYFPRIAKAYLIGYASDDFAATLEGAVPYERCETLDVALARAAGDAAHCPGPEPVVLLSPACASYDQFRSFEHRGDTFRDLVRAMPGVTR
ncbi:MAG: UDP-N-acetylmuramoyl-L-alanine--D-glutamate ligase [Hyphomicrobiaceae bacterium]